MSRCEVRMTYRPATLTKILVVSLRATCSTCPEAITMTKESVTSRWVVCFRFTVRVSCFSLGGDQHG